ncbi:MAG: fimbrillin family protein [Alistipes sp.]|nr:fimbrillin family protein [Alistipes sp.]
MKKIFCAVLALAAMASCSKEYIVAEDKQAIGFGEAFVDNGTRADYSSGNDVQSFKVYGTLTGNSNTVQIFNGADVTRPTDLASGVYDSDVAWTCTETQYWVPSASYKFAAIVDGAATATDGLPATIPFTVADGDANKDLLYATVSATTDEDGEVETGTNASGLVAFEFDHLLSKVQFTVANKMATGYSIEVTSITVGNVAEDGLYTIEDEEWEATTTDKTNLTFGNTGVIASTNSAVASATRQILPVEQELAVTIVYNIYYNDNNGGGNQQISTATKTGTIPAQTYVKNTVYNITAAIDGKKIEFTVNSVNGWTSGDIDGDGDIDTDITL